MAAAAGEALQVANSHVLVCSTGIIGTPLPIDAILAATPKLAKKLSVDGADDAAAGILTTDHKPKQVVINGSSFTVGGMAKGCGMIAPNMATMLAFLTTDADVPQSVLQIRTQGSRGRDLQHAECRRRDLDQRHGDAACLRPARQGRSCEFADAVLAACRELTMQMARDAEGMTRIAHLTVTGARSR